MKKNLILVGAGKGLGNAIAKIFGKHNFRLFLISRDIDHLKQYQNDLSSEGIEVYIFVADAKEPKTLTKAINNIVVNHGTPDVLIYNVGVTESDGNYTVNNELLMQRYQVDVASAFHCATLVATKKFADKEGVILFTGGGFAKTFQPTKNLVPLSIDKAALNAVNVILHEEMKPKGIFVGSIIVKGAIMLDSDHNATNIAKAYWKMYQNKTDFEVII